MGITSRKKRPLKREIPHLRDTRLIIIASEGAVTEKKYFESSLFHSRRIQVKVLETEGGHSSPESVLNRLRAFKKEFQLSTLSGNNCRILLALSSPSGVTGSIT